MYKSIARSIYQAQPTTSDHEGNGVHHVTTLMLLYLVIMGLNYDDFVTGPERPRALVEFREELSVATQLDKVQFHHNRSIDSAISRCLHARPSELLSSR